MKTFVLTWMFHWKPFRHTSSTCALNARGNFIQKQLISTMLTLLVTFNWSHVDAWGAPRAITRADKPTCHCLYLHVILIAWPISRKTWKIKSNNYRENSCKFRCTLQHNSRENLSLRLHTTSSQRNGDNSRIKYTEKIYLVRNSKYFCDKHYYMTYLLILI